MFKLRSQIMSRGEHFFGYKLFQNKFTKNMIFFLHGVQTNYDIYMQNKKSEHIIL